MDYEKKYKDTLERAKKLYEQGTITESLCYVFPELKESEDEKTRKEIIYHIKNCDDTIDEETEKRMIAWLENIPYTIDHEKREGFYLGYKAGLEKQGNQKPAWSEGDETLLSSVINSLLIFEDSGASKMKIDWLKHIRKRIKGE